MAKRKYTVSEKVVAANRRNLAKAMAVPASIRLRVTERRKHLKFLLALGLALWK